MMSYSCGACGKYLGDNIAAGSDHFCDFIPSYSGKNMRETDIKELRKWANKTDQIARESSALMRRAADAMEERDLLKSQILLNNTADKRTISRLVDESQTHISEKEVLLEVLRELVISATDDKGSERFYVALKRAAKEVLK